jgi:K+-transporting ATPase ATPase C chain
MLKQLGPAIRITLFFTILTGLIYPGVVTGLCQLLFPAKANGSLVMVNGQVVGSSLIGQNFSKPEYFQPRPSAANFRKDNPDYTGPIPADLVTASASGLDPDLSPGAVVVQAQRIAKARGVGVEKVNDLISRHIQERQLGFLGERRVNVLELNLALDREFPRK